MAALSDDDANDKNSTDNASMPPSLQDDGSNLISIEEFEELCLRRFEEGDVLYLTVLADQVAKDDPNRARGFYEQAIQAGDGYHATNKFALYIKDSDPARARELHQRSIAAGNPTRFDIPWNSIGDQRRRSVTAPIPSSARIPAHFLRCNTYPAEPRAR